MNCLSQALKPIVTQLLCFHCSLFNAVFSRAGYTRDSQNKEILKLKTCKAYHYFSIKGRNRRKIKKNNVSFANTCSDKTNKPAYIVVPDVTV